MTLCIIIIIVSKQPLVVCLTYAAVGKDEHRKKMNTTHQHKLNFPPEWPGSGLACLWAVFCGSLAESYRITPECFRWSRPRWFFFSGCCRAFSRLRWTVPKSLSWRGAFGCCHRIKTRGDFLWQSWLRRVPFSGRCASFCFVFLLLSWLCHLVQQVPSRNSWKRATLAASTSTVCTCKVNNSNNTSKQDMKHRYQPKDRHVIGRATPTSSRPTHGVQHRQHQHQKHRKPHQLQQPHQATTTTLGCLIFRGLGLIFILETDYTNPRPNQILAI